MASDRALRLQAGFALARALGEPVTRSVFAEHGYESEQQIVVVLESDTLQSVFARIQRYEPPVVVAIYWPDSGKLTYTQMEPGDEPEDYSPERDDVGGASTIGMLWTHAARQANASYRFRLNWGSAPTVTFERFAIA